MKRVTKRVEYEVRVKGPYVTRVYKEPTLTDAIGDAKAFNSSPGYKATIFRIEITEKRTICR